MQVMVLSLSLLGILNCLNITPEDCSVLVKISENLNLNVKALLFYLKSFFAERIFYHFITNNFSGF